MALKLGAYTACLHDRPLEAALDVLGSHGLTSVEVNTGGFIPSRTATSTCCCPRPRPAGTTSACSPPAAWNSPG
jgi:sugar phosphate isomerase/epimerase